MMMFFSADDNNADSNPLYAMEYFNYFFMLKIKILNYCINDLFKLPNLKNLLRSNGVTLGVNGGHLQLDLHHRGHTFKFDPSPLFYTSCERLGRPSHDRFGPFQFLMYAK